MTPILSVEGLSHLYSKGTPFEKVAIDRIDFQIPAGQFVGLIGHTGSGKSTLIQHLNGLLKPTQGRVLFEGEDIYRSKEATRSVRFSVGLVFQYPEYQLFEETVYRDIAFGPKNKGLSEAEIDDCVKEAADFAGVARSDFEKSPLELSGGQKRRVAIAGVIAMRPKVLILDEPTAGLDPGGRESILQQLCTYHAQTGATILLVTHSMEDIAELADRILVMNEGHLVMDGTPAEIFSHGENLQAMSLDIPEATRIAAALRQRGLPLPPVYTEAQLLSALLALRGGAPNA